MWNITHVCNRLELLKRQTLRLAKIFWWQMTFLTFQLKFFNGFSEVAKFYRRLYDPRWSEYMAVKLTGLLSRLEPHLNWGHTSHNVLPTNSTTTASNIVFITKSSTCNRGMNTITSCFCLESTVTAQQQNDDNESGQVPLSDPLGEVLRPKFGLRPDLSQNFTWRRRFGLRIFLDRI